MPTTVRARTLVAAGLILTIAGCGRRAPDAGPRPERMSEEELRMRAYSGSSVSVLTERDLGETRVTRIEELLMGRVAGLQVIRRSNGDYSLRIRGVNSFRDDGDPLVILDGMPLRTWDVGASLRSLDPNDVSRIEVLKDAGSTAFYGSRGMNGVIIITTKRGP